MFLLAVLLPALSRADTFQSSTNFTEACHDIGGFDIINQLAGQIYLDWEVTPENDRIDGVSGFTSREEVGDYSDLPMAVNLPNRHK